MSGTFLEIRDYDGVTPAAKMRVLFESSVTGTERLSKRFPLEMGGTGYLDEKTQAAWVGFAIGIRCAERIAKERCEICGEVKPVSEMMAIQPICRNCY